MDHLIFVKLACIPNFSFLSELEVTFPGGWGGVGGWVGGGWLETDNKTISVQLNLTGTGTEFGNIMNAMNAERTDTKELSKPTYRGGQTKCRNRKG